MKESWFRTWDRPKYVEWALPQDYGYLLVIARKQPDNWLLARAKLVFEKEGLPGFEVLESIQLDSEQEALKKISEWKESAG